MTDVFRPPPTDDEHAAATALIDSFLRDRLDDPDDAVVGVDRDARLDGRWYVRMAGEAREATTIWFTLGQRTLSHETQVLPAPPVWDGMALAGGRLYVAMEDGAIQCMKPSR